MNLWLYWNNSFVQILIKIEKWKLNATETIGSNWKEKKKIWKKNKLPAALHCIMLPSMHRMENSIRCERNTHTHNERTNISRTAK